MRLFLAIELTDEVRDHIATLQRILPVEVRPVKPSQAHITLAFLGEQDPCETERALAHITCAPFTITLDSVGGFPNLTSPRVVYLGGPPVPEVLALAKRIDETLPFTRDKPFRVHATIARVKHPVEFDFSKLPMRTFRIPVREFVLFTSELRPQGPVYRALARLALNG